MDSWNYVASSGSSTTERASDVSPSHLFHPSPGTCRLFGFVWVLVFGLWVGLVFGSFLLLVFCKCLGMF